MKQLHGVLLWNSSLSLSLSLLFLPQPTHYRAFVARMRTESHLTYVQHIRTRTRTWRPVEDKLSISSADTDKPHSRHQFSRMASVVTVSTISRLSVPRMYIYMRQVTFIRVIHSTRALSITFSIDLIRPLLQRRARCHGDVDRPKPSVWPVQSMLGMPRSAAQSFHSLQVKRRTTTGEEFA